MHMIISTLMSISLNVAYALHHPYNHFQVLAALFYLLPASK